VLSTGRSERVAGPRRRRDHEVVDFSGLQRDQDGVVARRQLIGEGLSPTVVAKLVRRGDLVPLHPGVYVDHNGPPTWQQHAWAAVLHAWPSALCLGSALRAAEGPGRRDRATRQIHVAIDGERRLHDVPGVVVHRMTGFGGRVQWNTGPPRVRYDESVLDVAAGARSDLDAVATLADAVGARRTTAARLLGRLRARKRIARREWLEAVLSDVAEGTCSVLEHSYQSRVVRPHGLPQGSLQAPSRATSGRVYRDVDHPELGLKVELDGRLFHTATQDRDRDLERDLDAAVDGAAATVRLGFGQAHERACSTAAKLGAVMNRLGWSGQAHPCPACATERDAAA